MKKGEYVKLKGSIEKGESLLKNIPDEDFTLLQGEKGAGKVLEKAMVGGVACAEILPIEIDGEYGKYQLIGGMEIGYTIPIEYLEKLSYTLEFEESKGE